MRTSFAAIVAAAGVALAACSGQSKQSTAPQSQVAPAAASPAVLTNPTDFALVEGSKILDVKAFKQTVSAGGDQSSVLTNQGAGTYVGNEVLAGSPASISGLHAWLAGIEKGPPPGYTYVASPSASTSSIAHSLDRYGIAYAVFRTTDPSKRRAVVVVVMDPKQVKAKLGIAIDLVDKYRALPDYMRQPIDNQLKAKTGISATEMLDPSAPLGMTLAALKELQTSDQRAIVMVDASKK
jgi:hypothetical protein